MPRPVVLLAAALLGLIALASFAMGIMNAPDRGGRLPGERAPGQASDPVTAINATEATPLSQERIEGPPPPPKPAVNKTEEANAGAANATTTGPLLPVPPMATNTTPPPATTPAPLPEDDPPH